MNKTVDEAIDSIKDKNFDKFTKGVIDYVHKKRDMILMMTLKKKSQH